MTNSLRGEIRQLIADIRPLDRLEEEHIQFVMDWIDSGAPLFRTQKPAIPTTHLVAYFLVISPSRGHVLLVDHKKSGLWLPSGGHVEPEEHPFETVRREVREELGIEANFFEPIPLFVTVMPTVGNVTRHIDVSLWFLLKANPSDPVEFDSDEFHQVKWFPIDDVPLQNAEPHLPRFLEKIEAGRNPFP